MAYRMLQVEGRVLSIIYYLLFSVTISIQKAGMIKQKYLLG